MNIDMAEATRLTRLGKLNEAMAILRGGKPIPADGAEPETRADIEMTQTADGAWRAKPSRSDHVRGSIKPKIDLKDLVKTCRGSFQAEGRGRSPALPAGARFSEAVYGEGKATRRCKLYVPSTYTGRPSGLIVMLHGCTQSADDFAAGTGMNDLAEQAGFLVLYPEQSTSANMNRCWNWFNDADQRRDRGEPALLVAMIRQVMTETAIDPQKVYVAGLSAGGAMAAILGARYPDVFSGVAVHSGVAVGAAHDMASAFGAMSQGATRSLANAQGNSVPTIVFHGDRDGTVHCRNGEQVIAQVLSGRKLTQTVTSGQSAGGQGYTRTQYAHPDGVPSIEHWVLHGAGHAWSGGHTAGSYTDARGPSASKEMVRFFMESRGIA